MTNNSVVYARGLNSRDQSGNAYNKMVLIPNHIIEFDERESYFLCDNESCELSRHYFAVIELNDVLIEKVVNHYTFDKSICFWSQVGNRS